MLTLSNGHSFDIACASGALAYGLGWWWERYVLHPMGVIRPDKFTIITKTLTWRPRAGNLKWWCPWRCVRLLPGGNVVNAVGLTNPGLHWWCQKGYQRYVCQTGLNVIVSVMPETPKEAGLMAACLDHEAGVKGFEVNVSCPNVAGQDFSDDYKVNKIVRTVKNFAARSRHPVGVKMGYLDPYVEVCRELRNVVEWVDLINTVPWVYLFPNRPSPLAKYGLEGGVSGPKIVPYARAALRDVVDNKVGVPVLSGGGIGSFQELAWRFAHGAAAVTLGTAFLRKPWLPNAIVQEWSRQRQGG